MIKLNRTSGMFHSSLIQTKHGFGTKLFGDGRNKILIHNVNEYPSTCTIISPKQTHSSNIYVINNQDLILNNPENIDGLITNIKGIVLSVITADCVPIIYEDVHKGIIGISHQGWKGTINGLPSKMIERMELMGSERSNIHCSIGPAINMCCYKVEKERMEVFENKFGNQIIDTKMNSINLLMANYKLLRASKLSPMQISYFPFCTSCNHDLFWSFRRDQSIQGEMFSFIKL